MTPSFLSCDTRSEETVERGVCVGGGFVIREMYVRTDHPLASARTS